MPDSSASIAAMMRLRSTSQLPRRASEKTAAEEGRDIVLADASVVGLIFVAVALLGDLYARGARQAGTTRATSRTPRYGRRTCPAGRGRRVHGADLALPRPPRRSPRSGSRSSSARASCVRVSAEVDPDLEITEIVDRVVKSGGPALLFEKPKGSQHPLLINQFGTERRMCLAFGVETLDDVAAKLGDDPRDAAAAGPRRRRCAGCRS